MLRTERPSAKQLRVIKRICTCKRELICQYEYVFVGEF